jgi:hypothetical protein
MKTPCKLESAPSHYLSWNSGYKMYTLHKKDHTLLRYISEREEADEALAKALEGNK